MNGNGKLWLPGVAGLTFVLLNTAALVLDFVIVGTTGGQPFFDLANAGGELARIQGSTAWLVGAALRVAQFVPIALFVPGLYWVFRGESDRGAAAHGALAVFLFWLFSTVQNGATLAVVAFLAPAYTAGSQGAAAIEAAAVALMSLGEVFFTMGGGLATLFMVAGMVFLGRLTLRSGRLPRWTGYAALASAAFSLVALFHYLVPALFPAALLGFLLFVLWTIGVSVGFLRSQRASAPAPTGTAGQVA